MYSQKLPKGLLSLVVLGAFVGLLITLDGCAGHRAAIKDKALPGIKLAYQMKKGQQLKYKTTMNVQNSMEMQGREMTTSSEITSALHLDIEEVGKDGKFTYVHALDSLSVTAKTPQGDQSFINPEGMIGKRTRQTISALGKKLNSVIVDSMQVPPALAQGGGGRQGAFRFVDLPEKEVKIGATWTMSTPDTNTQMGGQIIVTPTSTYTVTGEVDTLSYKCLRLSYTGKLVIKGNGVNMGMNFTIEGEGPTSGAVYFAPKEGLLVAMTGNSDMESTVALTGQMSMTIPQSTATKMSFILVK